MQGESGEAPRAGGDDITLDRDGGQNHGDWSVLSLLLAPDGHAGLWSVEELGRMLQDQVQAVDSVGRLLRDGLVDQNGNFVFATRAATRFNEIAE
jgi:hypothetical protein